MEVDGSMAPLEELNDSTKGLEGWHSAGFVVKLFDPYYKHQGFIFIPLSQYDSWSTTSTTFIA
jgi:hypothetical protein